MPKGEGIHREIGRQIPTPGAHIYLGQPNIFFVTVNAKDAKPWMANTTVQNSLADIWRAEATAWLVGYYLIMPDHVHFFVLHAICISGSTNGSNSGKAGSVGVTWSSHGRGSANRLIIA